MAKTKRQDLKIVRKANGDVLVIQRPAVVAAKKRATAAVYAPRVKQETKRSGSLLHAALH